MPQVCVWRSEEAEPQHATESAAALGAKATALEQQLSQSVEERRVEHEQWGEERDALNASEAELRARLEEAHVAQDELLQEVSASMQLQEQDMAEAERLRALLGQREVELRGLQSAREEDEAALASAAEREEVRPDSRWSRTLRTHTHDHIHDHTHARDRTRPCSRSRL